MDIHVWPCGTACIASDLEHYLQFMSDDYLTLEMHSDETFDEAVARGMAIQNGETT